MVKGNENPVRQGYVREMAEASYDCTISELITQGIIDDDLMNVLLSSFIPVL